MVITSRIVIGKGHPDSVKYQENAQVSESVSRNIIGRVFQKLWVFEKKNLEKFMKKSGSCAEKSRFWSRKFFFSFDDFS